MKRKQINVNWNDITDKLQRGEIAKIEDFSAIINTSRPTAKKILAEHYGDRIVFSRGRAGGIVFLPAPVSVTA
jgi:hypothetical protein